MGSAMGPAAMIGQAVGGMFMAKMQYDESRGKAEINRRNAEQARMAARDAWHRGEHAVGKQRRKLSMLIGEQRAATGASGIDVGSGTVADVLADTSAMGELDALTLEHNVAREAWGLGSQADAYDYQARMAEHLGDIQVMGTLVSAGAGVAASGATLEVFGGGE